MYVDYVVVCVEGFAAESLTESANDMALDTCRLEGRIKFANESGNAACAVGRLSYVKNSQEMPFALFVGFHARPFHLGA